MSILRAIPLALMLLVFFALAACDGETNKKDKEQLSGPYDLGQAAQLECNPTEEPFYSRQWHLNNTGQFGAVPGVDVNIEPLWAAGFYGQGIRIAVIDDGVDVDHPEFAGRIVLETETAGLNQDVLDDDTDPDAIPGFDAHGQSVAGVAAAGADCAGSTGAAPLAEIIPIRLLGFNTSDTDEAEAFAVAMALEADVINNSWGPVDDEGRYPFLNEALGELFKDLENLGRDGKGAAILWAAGNGNQPVSWDGYASHPSVIAIGALSDQGSRAFYSDYGPAIMATAPSSGGTTPGIFTTDVLGCGGYFPGQVHGGDVFVQVYSYEGSGTYSLTLGNGAGSYTEANNGANNEVEGAEAVDWDTTVTGNGGQSSGNPDIDFYTVGLPASGSLQFELDVPAGADFDLYVYCSDYPLIGFSEEFGSTTETITIGGLFGAEFPEGGYTTDFGGTSSATPLAAGVIAAVMSAYPDLTLSNIRWLLKNTSSQDVQVGSFPFGSNGHSEGLGFGLIDGGAMFNAAEQPGSYRGASRSLGGYNATASKPGERRTFGQPTELAIHTRHSTIYFTPLRDAQLTPALAQAAQERGLKNRGVQIDGTKAQALVSGQVLVALVEDSSLDEAQDLLTSFGLSDVRQIYGRLYVGQGGESPQAVFKAAAALREHPQVAAAGPDMIKNRRRK